MNTDTIRDIKRIKANGYYLSSETLGEGGWPEVYKFASDWLNYVLYDDGNGEALQTIAAKDDVTAIKAFTSLFRLSEFPHEIVEKKVTFRSVQELA